MKKKIKIYQCGISDKQRQENECDGREKYHKNEKLSRKKNKTRIKEREINLFKIQLHHFHLIGYGSRDKKNCKRNIECFFLHR